MSDRISVPLMDLAAQHKPLEAELKAAFHDVLHAGQFILGPNVKALEQEVADYLGMKHGVGLASGTDALILSLKALGIGPGDEVIVPAYTFFATAEAVLNVGATPVLVDVDPDTYCIDVDQAIAHITPKTRAMIPVHLYGHPADIDPLMAAARDRGIHVLEDNAQGFGAKYRGRKAGGLCDVGCLSFFPSKNLGGLGDGGMMVTNDDAVAERVRMLRTHGWKKKYHPEVSGYNSRLDELQAAFVRIKLKHIDDWNAGRLRVAAKYAQALQIPGVKIPCAASDVYHIYHLYMIAVSNRESVAAGLKERGISTAVYYPLPLHFCEPLKDLGYKEGDFPVSEKASRETLALPMFPEMTDQQIDAVAAAIREVIKAS